MKQVLSTNSLEEAEALDNEEMAEVDEEILREIYPFHTYTMKQAIEEGFILDVLKNYLAYATYFELVKKIQDDPEYDEKKAKRLLRTFVEKHPIAIARKMLTKC